MKPNRIDYENVDEKSKDRVMVDEIIFKDSSTEYVEFGKLKKLDMKPTDIIDVEYVQGDCYDCNGNYNYICVKRPRLESNQEYQKRMKELDELEIKSNFRNEKQDKERLEEYKKEFEEGIPVTYSGFRKRDNVKKHIFSKELKEGETFTYSDIEHVDLQDTDRFEVEKIEIDEEHGYDWNGQIIYICREVLESDIEYQKRMEDLEVRIKEWTKNKYEHYLELKAKYEPDSPVSGIYD